MRPWVAAALVAVLAPGIAGAAGDGGADAYAQGMAALGRGACAGARTHLRAAADAGHGPAAVELAQLLFFGRPPSCPPDAAAATEVLLGAPGCKRHPECHYMLGMFYDAGLGGLPRDRERALLHMGVAAEGHSRAALLALSSWYAHGHNGVPRSCERARTYIAPVASSLAAQIERERLRTFPKHALLEDALPEEELSDFLARLLGRSPAAAYFEPEDAPDGALEDLDDRPDLDARPDLENRPDLDDRPNAEGGPRVPPGAEGAALGAALHEGRAPAARRGADAPDVLEFYRYSAAEGDAGALLFLGQVHYLGLAGVARDYAAARRYFEAARARGSISATALLGQMDFYGEGIDAPQLRRAFHLLRRAARADSPTGLNGMGLFYWRGAGEVAPDAAEALRYFRRAADLDHAEASYNAALVLAETGAPDDAVFAALVTALRGGHVLAGHVLAARHAGRPGGCGLALFLWENFVRRHPMLSLLDEAAALFRGGLPEYALPRLLHVAAQGFEVAQHNAAHVLEHVGRALASRDPAGAADAYARAALWWGRAAAQPGTASAAQKRLGDLFLAGRGVPRLPAVAAAYYHAAGGLAGTPAGDAGPSPSGIVAGAQGHAPVLSAVFALGRLYHVGAPGVPRDARMARRMYDRVVRGASASGASPGDEHAWLPATAMLCLLRAEECLSGMGALFRRAAPLAVALLALLLSAVLWRRRRQNARPAERPTDPEAVPLLRE